MRALDARLKGDQQLNKRIEHGVKAAAELFRADKSPSRSMELDGAAQPISLNDILTNDKLSIMDKITALFKEAFSMIKDALSGFSLAKMTDAQKSAPARESLKSGNAMPRNVDQDISSKPSSTLSSSFNTQSDLPDESKTLAKSMDSKITTAVSNTEKEPSPITVSAENYAFNETGLSDASDADYAKINKIKADAAFTERLPGDLTIGSGVGIIDEVNGVKYENGQLIEDEEEKSRDNATAVAEAIEQADEVQKKERERATMMSQRDLDAMEWTGDVAEIWQFGSNSGSRQSWYEAARATRAKLAKLAEENDWTEDARTKQEKALSDYMKATKEGNEKEAQQAWVLMSPETRREVMAQKDNMIQLEDTLSKETVTAISNANDLTANQSASANARADMLATASLSEITSVPAPINVIAKESALSNPPEIALRDEFSLAASDDVPTLTTEQQVQLSAASTAPKAVSPVLNQEFSI